MIVLIPNTANPANEKQAVLVAELLALTSTTKERRSGHWIPVHTDHWRRVLGGSYALILREAIQTGLVEVNPRYSAGRFSRSYRLPKALRTPDCREYELRRVKAPDVRVRLDPDDQVGHRLVDHFAAVELSGVVTSGWGAYAVRACQAGNYYAMRCEYGRFHSTFTAMPKLVRALLTFNSTSVAEIDVRNAQPLLLAVQVRPAGPPTKNQITPTSTNPNIPTIHMLHTSGGSGEFLEACQDGQLYELLLGRCQDWRLRDWVPARYRHWVKDRALCRQDVKRQFLVLMFADLPTTKSLPLFNIVARDFPAVAAYIVEAKQNDYRELARRCQRLESLLMIDQVAAELTLLGPVVTIHDSVIVPVDRIDQATSTIQSAWSRYGVRVTLRTNMTTENASDEHAGKRSECVYKAYTRFGVAAETYAPGF